MSAENEHQQPQPPQPETGEAEHHSSQAQRDEEI